ncbi:MAG TPA: hypothetical protein VGP04_11025 [Pseudonocardiaceae bacterium]|jgi:hypothetical protein|nr:hypothetical protein [Pseudonocardiaceae bacterium]
MEPPITVPIEAAALVPVAGLSTTTTGEETTARATGIGGHRLEAQVPVYYMQYSDSGAHALMAQDDERGPDAAQSAQEYARWTWAEE